MKAELLIKPFSHAEEIIVEDQNDKIDFFRIIKRKYVQPFQE